MDTSRLHHTATPLDNLHIRVFWRENEESVFWSYPLAGKANNEHHFSRSYENRSKTSQEETFVILAN